VVRLGRRPLLLASLGTARAGAAVSAPAFEPYARPDLLEALPFGTHSHWLQPWRVSAETLPASVLALGVGMNGVEAVDAAQARDAMAMLAAHGIGTVRIEIPWAAVDHATESHLSTEDRLRPVGRCRAGPCRPPLPVPPPRHRRTCGAGRR
jgi:hypothetical protein